MNIYQEGLNRLSAMKDWHNSEEYLMLCNQLKAECSRLLVSAQHIYKELKGQFSSIEHSATRVEVATGGDVHRGVYCPSPIYDIVIGNVHRGRILKRVSAASNPSHYFGFDQNGTLLYTKTMCEGMHENTEYLVRRGNSIYGITLNPMLNITAICEECYENEKLTSYRYASILSEEDSVLCLTFHSEFYSYDKQGLKACKWEDFEPISNTLQLQFYEFEKEGEYLSSYTFAEEPFISRKECRFPPREFSVKIKRKA